MVIVFYISGHGLGHASRDLEIIKAIRQLRPESRVVVRTSASPWFFEASRVAGIELQPTQVDTGVVQIDSIRLDEEATARKAREFYATFDARVGSEAVLLDKLGAALVLGDMPPLAFAAAKRARIPSVAVGNFTWDWIYSGYPQFDLAAPGVITQIGQAYGDATRALRMPMHGGFETIGEVRDIAFVARHATRSRGATRHALEIADNAIVVLASFGGYGLRLPYDAIARNNPFTLVLTAHEFGTSDTPVVAADRLIVARDVAYPDLVAAADVVVSKPGYGIVSECAANQTALLYTARGRFIEHDVMVAEMPRWLRCRFISQEDLLAGRWATAIDALLAQPTPPERAATHGADVAAQEIVRMLMGAHDRTKA